MIKSRIDIKNFVLEIENKFPVNQWKIDSIHLWPYLRIKLFFYLIHSIEKSEVKNRDEKPKSKEIFLKSTYRNVRAVFRYYRWLKSLPKKKYIFVGADAHRVDYRNARFNRYFDILIEKYEIESDSIYFEYGLNSGKQYNKDLIFTFSEALKGFLYLKKFNKLPQNVHLEGYDSFLVFLSKDKLFNRFITIYSKELVTQWAHEKLYPKVLFFKKVFQIIKPEKVLILCYYLDDIFALTAAANQLKITTVEMQHGPQSNVHLAYSSWYYLPESGYDMVPNNFWCWDKGSHDVIQDWTKNNANYSVDVIGNPWIDYWKTKELNYNHQNYILYTLQPNPLTLNQLFPESIVDFIKNNPYEWFIRLHPRQLNEKDTIKSFLKSRGVLELVNLDEASTDPLPLLLSKASLHLTHFSGAAIEASFFNVFTVLLNEIGVFSFQDLISSQKAVYLNPDDTNFQQKLNTFIQQKSNLQSDINVTFFKKKLFE
ncbi:hypothetical protein [Flavobacterium sp.]|jgi:hypothetical protein|uniref:hypothetical protein n=1 Tax=Flavobacterium sp. TaxID=239 RepID=UPI0037BFB034